MDSRISIALGGTATYSQIKDNDEEVNYKKNDGRVVVLKINPEQFKPAIDLEAVLAYTGHSFNDMPLYLEEYDKINIIAKIFANSLYFSYNICYNILDT